MQTVQFFFKLQEAPRVVSDVISVAFATHSWEFCFSGRILGGTVSVDVGVTHHFLFRFAFCYSSDGTNAG